MTTPDRPPVPRRILLVDDDDGLRAGMAELVEDLGHCPVQARDGLSALAVLDQREGVDAVVLDLRMPGLDGIEVLRRIRARAAPPPVAILTAVATAQNTIEAMRLGAVDHLTKPVGREAFTVLIGRLLAAGGRAVDAAGPDGARADESALIGASAAMREVQKTIGRVADGDVSVLITGETGTGKEVVAQTLHRSGRRASGPFVAVNCAAIPAALLESQLFGHVRGAFTGATADQLGALRAADGGTLLLDEIGDMELAMQAKLLRVLQEREVTPLGGRAVKVDLRLVCATHRDLVREVAEGRFRQDLYYRIAVVPIALPPLRERLADIVELAEHFLALAEGDAPRRLAADAAALLVAHRWPGNVRELRNVVERAAALSRETVLGAADFAFLGEARPLAAEAMQPKPGESLPEALARLERAMILRALAQAGGNRAQAARRLGIARQALYERMRRLDVSENPT